MTRPLEQIADKYEILGQLGESGAVEVYKIHHRFLDEVRLLKVIQPPVAMTEAAGQAYLREARQAMRLRHPNIAQLFDFSFDDFGHVSLVTEYLEGLNLEEALAELGRPPVGLALEIAQQALRAIGYLHRSGMVHRDIAPERLYLTRDLDGQPLVKWVDLGVARILAAGEGGLPMAGLFPERPRYGAPEQFGAGGGREPDARSDLYSFGVLLYELLTGRCPIAGHDPFSYMAGHLSAPPLPFAESDPEGSLPEELRQAVLQALAKAPAERVRSADDLARRLAAVQARSPEQGDYLDRALERARERYAAALRPIALPAPPAKPAPKSAPALAPAVPSLAEQWTAPLPLGYEAQQSPTLPVQRESAAPSPSTLPVPEAAWDQRQLGYTSQQLRFDAAPPALDELPVPPAAPAPAPAAPAEPRAPGGGRGRMGLAWAGGFLLIVVLGGVAGWSLRRWGGSPAAASPPASVPAAPTAPPPTLEVAPAPTPPTPVGRERAPLGSDPREERKRRAGGSTAEFQLAETLAERQERQDRQGRRERRTASSPPSSPASSPVPEGPFQRGDLIRLGPGVEYPEATTPVTAPYPEAARGSGRRAKVKVALLVDENGNVLQARVQEGEHGELGFNEAAQEAAKRMHYLPATKNGIPGKFWTDLIYEFEPPPATPATPP